MNYLSLTSRHAQHKNNMNYSPSNKLHASQTLFATTPHSRNKHNATVPHPNLYPDMRPHTCGEEFRGFSRKSRGFSRQSHGVSPLLDGYYSPASCQSTQLRLASPAPQLVENLESAWPSPNRKT